MVNNKCKCGCGEKVNSGNKYIHGHNRKFKSGKDNPQFGKPNNWGNHMEETKTKISQDKERARKISESRKGMTFSKEHLENLKISHMGQKAWNKDTNGIMKPNKTSFKKGHKLTPKGKDHQWYVDGKGYLGYSNEFMKIRKLIKKRDNFKCQSDWNECKGKLGVHHIDYNKQNNSPMNLITLCSRHNTLANINRKHWEKHFKMKMFIKTLFNPKNLLIFNGNKQLVSIQ